MFKLWCIDLIIGYIKKKRESWSWSYGSCEFEPHSWRGVLDTFCDKVCQWLVTGRWFPPPIKLTATITI